MSAEEINACDQQKLVQNKIKSRVKRSQQDYVKDATTSPVCHMRNKKKDGKGMSDEKVKNRTENADETVTSVKTITAEKTRTLTVIAKTPTKAKCKTPKKIHAANENRNSNENCENKIVKFVETIEAIEKSGALKMYYNKNLQLIPSVDAKFDSFQRLANFCKNQNPNIWCIESSRVKLKSVAGGAQPPSDYIHANYIRIDKLKNSYITTQEPLPSTRDDFWRMIYGEDVSVIISLGQGAKFWPDKRDEYRNFGEFFVTCKKIFRSKHNHSPIKYLLEVLPDGCSQSLVVELFHYSQWSKTGIPSSSKALSALIKCAKSKTSSPIVVQCETGTNQSAAFVLAHIIIALLYSNQTVELEPLFRELRKQKQFFLSQPQHFVYVILGVLFTLRAKLTKKITLPETIKTILVLEAAIEMELNQKTVSKMEFLIKNSPPSSSSDMKWDLA